MRGRGSDGIRRALASRGFFPIFMIAEEHRGGPIGGAGFPADLTRPLDISALYLTRVSGFAPSGRSFWDG